MRIAAIEPSGRLYGSEYCLLDVLKLNKDQGIAWTVITPPGSFAELLEKNEKDVAVLPSLPPHLHLKSKWFKLYTYTRLFKSLAQLRPDIIYVNQAGILRASHLIAKILRLNVVCQVQTLEDAASFSRLKNTYERVLSFVCNSQFIADKTDVDPKRKCILFQGVHRQPPPLQSTSSNRFNAERLRLGILGRISYSKGHYMLAEAAKTLVELGCNFSIRVIGDGLTPQDTANWQTYINNSGMQHYFDFRGYRTNLREELREVDLLLIPSIAEPLGRVLFDAANYQVPVIVSDGGGLGEIASLYRVGVPFKSGDTRSLVDAILTFQNERTLETEKFIEKSQQMLASLSMNSYLEYMKLILESAKLGRPCNVTWFGDHVPRD